MKLLINTPNLITTFVILLLTSYTVTGSEVKNAEFKSDWQSPEAIVNALYTVISADAGVQRDWDRFRDLFFDNAEMLIAMESSQFSGILASDIETIIAQTDSAYGKTGFHETEIAQKVIKYGNLASVYSSYEVKFKTSDTQPFMKGLNHFQLLFDGDRWWIISNSGIIDNNKFKASAVLN